MQTSIVGRLLALMILVVVSCNLLDRVKENNGESEALASVAARLWSDVK